MIGVKSSSTALKYLGYLKVSTALNSPLKSPYWNNAAQMAITVFQSVHLVNP